MSKGNDAKRKSGKVTESTKVCIHCNGSGLARAYEWYGNRGCQPCEGTGVVGGVEALLNDSSSGSSTTTDANPTNLRDEIEQILESPPAYWFSNSGATKDKRDELLDQILELIEQSKQEVEIQILEELLIYSNADISQGVRNLTLARLEELRGEE